MNLHNTDTKYADKVAPVIANIIHLSESEQFRDHVKATPFNDCAKFRLLLDNILYCGNSYGISVGVFDTNFDEECFIREARKLTNSNIVLEINKKYFDGGLLALDMSFSLSE
ncbi:hypothetical protein [Photobacterium damselae]|uniref:hypothetical protein n=1 Tax=Photobacterium damselae TaxID=38293 RepID=UPI001F3CD5ED|nr:hypothetical protein [Photobacterium damselae]UKA04785.1 hypothetical protein IHC89_21320 [Photobacterium damselae subsp. damselae]